MHHSSNRRDRCPRITPLSVGPPKVARRYAPAMRSHHVGGRGRGGAFSAHAGRSRGTGASVNAVRLGARKRPPGGICTHPGTGLHIVALEWAQSADCRLPIRRFAGRSSPRAPTPVAGMPWPGKTRRSVASSARSTFISPARVWPLTLRERFSGAFRQNSMPTPGGSTTSPTSGGQS